MKRRLVRLLQRYVVNPPMKAALSLGIVAPTHVVLETTGRKSGKPWQVPVGNGLADDGNTLWIVAEHGHEAGYVKNILAHPRVRVRIGRAWRSGTAAVLPDDDPRARLKAIGHRVNGFMVRAAGTDLLTVRIDLDRPRPPPIEPE